MAVKLSRSQVNFWRLSRNHLDKRVSNAQMAQVVSDLCGVQAQVLSGAALSVWARVKNITVQDVQDALWKDRSLVKTWAMRGTLHLLSSTDLPIYTAALKTRLEHFREEIPYRIGPEHGDKQYHITSDEQEQVTRAIHNALDKRILTREELAREIVKRVKLRPIVQSHLLSGFGSLLQPAAFQGSLIFGPSQGPKVTFTRPDQWLRKWDEPASDQALKTLVRQFYTTYGPATHQDFGHWWGVPPPAARKLVAPIADELEPVEFNGHQSMMRKSDIDHIQTIDEAHSIRLVPSWDTYVMFYHPRELFVAETNRLRIFSPIQGNAPVLLIDGVAGGTWKKRVQKKKAEIIVRPFKPLKPSQKRAIGEEVSLLGEFLGTNTRVSYST